MKELSRLRDMASHRNIGSVSDEKKKKPPQKITDKITIWSCATK